MAYHINRQIGNYVIYSQVENVAPFFVRMAGNEHDDRLSEHGNVTEAVKAILSYKAADDRRVQ